MKKNYLLFTVSALLIVMISSCSKDENSETCHPCHLETALWADIVDADGNIVAHAGDIEIWDIANSEGVVGGNFCDQEKEDAESPTFDYSFPTGDLVGDFSGAILTQAYYDEHSDDFVVHCEAHEGDDHDDHDHGDHDSVTCHPCHLEAVLWADIVNADGDTVAHAGDIEVFDIANSEGVVGGDFCGQEMEDAESPTFDYSFPTGDLVGDFSGVVLTQAYYDEHSDDFVVHCEEHEDHDDHDHDDGK